MCKELADELEKGKGAARKLVEHLLLMGAESCQIPIILDDEAFVVSVSRPGEARPRKDDPPS